MSEGSASGARLVERPFRYVLGCTRYGCENAAQAVLVGGRMRIHLFCSDHIRGVGSLADPFQDAIPPECPKLHLGDCRRCDLCDSCCYKHFVPGKVFYHRVWFVSALLVGKDQNWDLDCDREPSSIPVFDSVEEEEEWWAYEWDSSQPHRFHVCRPCEEILEINQSSILIIDNSEYVVDHIFLDDD